MLCEKKKIEPECLLPNSFDGRLTTISPTMELIQVEISVQEIRKLVLAKLPFLEIQKSPPELSSSREKVTLNSYIDRLVLNIIYTEQEFINACPNPECDFYSEPGRSTIQPGVIKKMIGGFLFACSKEHKNYLCAHPKCIQRALRTEWRYATHYWNTPIGVEHYNYSFLPEEKSEYDKTVKYYEDNKKSAIKRSVDGVGNVYIIKSNGRYKIGKTTDMPSRFSAIQLSSPDKIELVYMINSIDYDSIEKSLHAMFKGKRVRGEWFELSDLDIDIIKSSYPAIERV